MQTTPKPQHTRKSYAPVASGLTPDARIKLPQIIGDPNTEPPIPPIFPVSKSAWWAGIKSGLYPKPVKIGPRTTAWRVEDILALIASV